MSAKAIPFPGFTALSEQVYVRDVVEGAADGPVSPNDPDVVILFGWGDGTPKNVSKYTDGFHKLFPAAKIFAVISPTFKATRHNNEEKIVAMMPLVDAAFPSLESKDKVLLHCMSNTGGIFLAATLVAYQRKFGTEHKLPHELLNCDSTPGGLVFWEQVNRWARALAVSTAKWFPWPFTVTQGLWYAYLCGNQAIEWVLGRKHAGLWAIEICNDLAIDSQDAHRLYLYSKADEIITWTDIEAGIAEAKEKGFSTSYEIFEDTPHVGHMRLHPEQYWAAILREWKVATGSK